MNLTLKNATLKQNNDENVVMGLVVLKGDQIEFILSGK